MKTWIGTSGFQYPEWKGKFYPEKMPPAKMLAFYAADFCSTEVNYTFRSLPSAKTIDRWRDETPENFRFSLKAPQRVTHFAKLRGCGDTINKFCKVVKGLDTKLGPVHTLSGIRRKNGRTPSFTTNTRKRPPVRILRGH